MPTFACESSNFTPRALRTQPFCPDWPTTDAGMGRIGNVEKQHCAPETSMRTQANNSTTAVLYSLDSAQCGGYDSK
jgi:hypothetical protein